MTKLKYSLLFGLLSCIGMQAHATQNLVMNGGFEADPPSGLVNTFQAGSSGLSGWSIVFGNVDLVGSALWAAAAGNNSLDLNGTRKGGIAQSLSTIKGQKYQLSFDLAGNFFGGDPVKEVSVNLASNGLFTFNTAGKSASNMGWSRYTTTFVAQSASTVLSFASNKRGAYGPALDNVSVTAVPEPETYAMLFAGLVLVGCRTRRGSVR